MSSLGLLFSILTGACLACFYMLNKKAATVGKPMHVIFWIFFTHIPIFVAWRAIVPPPPIDLPAYLPYGLAVGGLTIAGNLLTIRALSLSPFSLIVPVLGLSPVFATLLSIPILHEWPALHQSAGIFLVVIGILWLYAPPEQPWNIFAFWPRFLAERGALPISLAALCWAMCAPMDKAALRHAPPQFHALFAFSLTVTVFFILALRSGSMRLHPIERRHWMLLAITGSLGGLSYIMQLSALQHAPAGAFEAIKRVMNQLLSVGFGYFLFQEKITSPKLIGITILTIGVPLIVL